MSCQEPVWQVSLPLHKKLLQICWLTQPRHNYTWSRYEVQASRNIHVWKTPKTHAKSSLFVAIFPTFPQFNYNLACKVEIKVYTGYITVINKYMKNQFTTSISTNYGMGKVAFAKAVEEAKKFLNVSEEVFENDVVVSAQSVGLSQEFTFRLY